jgi:hypothetical protein
MVRQDFGKAEQSARRELCQKPTVRDFSGSRPDSSARGRVGGGQPWTRLAEPRCSVKNMCGWVPRLRAARNPICLSALTEGVCSRRNCVGPDPGPGHRLCTRHGTDECPHRPGCVLHPVRRGQPAVERPPASLGPARQGVRQGGLGRSGPSSARPRYWIWEGLWRISLEAVDGWALGAAGEETHDDSGPFERLLGT